MNTEPTTEEKLAKVATALERIIAYVDPGRPKHWHLYPEELRSLAVGALLTAGYPVKQFSEYEDEGRR